MPAKGKKGTLGTKRKAPQHRSGPIPAAKAVTSRGRAVIKKPHKCSSSPGLRPSRNADEPPSIRRRTPTTDAHNRTRSTFHASQTAPPVAPAQPPPPPAKRQRTTLTSTRARDGPTPIQQGSPRPTPIDFGVMGFHPSNLTPEQTNSINLTVSNLLGMRSREQTLICVTKRSELSCATWPALNLTTSHLCLARRIG